MRKLCASCVQMKSHLLLKVVSGLSYGDSDRINSAMLHDPALFNSINITASNVKSQPVKIGLLVTPAGFKPATF